MAAGCSRSRAGRGAEAMGWEAMGPPPPGVRRVKLACRPPRRCRCPVRASCRPSTHPGTDRPQRTTACPAMPRTGPRLSRHAPAGRQCAHARGKRAPAPVAASVDRDAPAVDLVVDPLALEPPAIRIRVYAVPMPLAMLEVALSRRRRAL
eukprot:scaffold10210_cov53-Phaeocystis_antarctica.AAC.3